MENMQDLFDGTFKKVREGDVLTGTVMIVKDEEVYVDLHTYAEGVIAKDQLSDDPNFDIKTDIQVGDEITATVIKVADENDNIVLSKKAAVDMVAWDVLRKYKEEGTILTVKVSGVVPAGVVAYVEGIRGFIPASKLALEYVEDLNPYLGQELQVQVINVEENDKKCILSAKEILFEKERQQKNSKIAKMEVGSVVEGTVESIQKYGAFITLDNGLSGLLHVSQICEKRIKSPAAVLNIGDRVTTKIIKIENNKLSLSIKALQDVAETTVEEETFEYEPVEEIGTGLSSLLAGIKLD